MEPPSHALHDELLAAAAYAAECSPVHKSCHLAAVFVVPVATSVAASREVFQNYSQTTNDMKRPTASRSSPKESKKTQKALAWSHWLPPKPWDPVEVPGSIPLGKHGFAFGPFPTPLMGEEVGILVPGFEAGTGAEGDEFRRPTADL